MKKTSLILILLLLLPAGVMAESYHVIIYADGIADINTWTAAQKLEVVTKYPPPPEVLASAAWINATAAQKWTYWVANVCPESVKRRVQQQGVLPILRGAADKLEVVEQYWKLAQEGTKYVFLLHLDVAGGQGAAIKDWLDRQTGIRYWYGRSMADALKSLWIAGRGGDAIAAAVTRRVIKYPVQIEVEGQPAIIYVPIIDAETTYSQTVQPQVLVDIFNSADRDKILPMKIFDGSK